MFYVFLHMYQCLFLPFQRRIAIDSDREKQSVKQTDRSSLWPTNKNRLSIHYMFILHIMSAVCLLYIIQTIHPAVACLKIWVCLLLLLLLLLLSASSLLLLLLLLLFALRSDTHHDPSAQDTDCNFEQNLQLVVPGGRCASSIHCMEKKWCCCSK